MGTSDTDTTTPTLNDLAPYPDSAENANCDAILRFVLATAQTSNHRAINADPWDRAEFREAVLAATAYWALAASLRALNETDPARADLVARDVWEGWEAGDTVGEQTWEWLVELGVDPEQVNAAWDRAAARKAAKAAEAGA